MKEFELIARLTRDLPPHPAVIAGPGDDCALVDLGIPDRWAVFKTDAVVEGIHFTPETEPERIGHKALARVLSDFAAAAATPTAAVITLAIPREHDVTRLDRLYAGLRRLADRWQVAVVGGETTTSPSPERLLVSVAAIGTVAHGRTVRRSGARAGDAVFVSGELGGSLEGRHLDFEPRLTEARWLADHFTIRAMIDLSDGLAGDLRHILDASHVGAELLRDSIPVSRAARLRSRRGDGAKTPLLAALTDGEDFELLFTVSSRDAVPLLDAWRTRFPDVRLTCIGRIIEGSALHLRHGREIQTWTLPGYTHFDSP